MALKELCVQMNGMWKKENEEKEKENILQGYGQFWSYWTMNVLLK